MTAHQPQPGGLHDVFGEGTFESVGAHDVPEHGRHQPYELVHRAAVALAPCVEQICGALPACTPVIRGMIETGAGCTVDHEAHCDHTYQERGKGFLIQVRIQEFRIPAAVGAHG